MRMCYIWRHLMSVFYIDFHRVAAIWSFFDRIARCNRYDPLHCRTFIHSPAVRSPALLPPRPKFHCIATVGPPRGTGRIPVRFSLNWRSFIPFSGRLISVTSPLDSIGLYSENPAIFLNMAIMTT